MAHLSDAAMPRFEHSREMQLREPTPQQHVEELWYKTTLDLKKLFPISRRYPFRQTFTWFLTLALISAGYTFLYHSGQVRFDTSLLDSLRFEKLALLSVVSGVLILKLAYQFLHRAYFQYRAEGFRLIIERGIILRETGSLPLLPVAEVYVRRSVLDLIFGLYQVHVAVPIDAGKSMAKIEGLSKIHAFRLKDFLSDQLSKQVFIPSVQQQEAAKI